MASFMLDHLSSVGYYTLPSVFAVSVLIFLYKFYLVRSQSLELKRQGLVNAYCLPNRGHRADQIKAMPPVHPILGHLLFCYKVMSKLPKDVHPHYLPDQIRRAIPELGPIYYLDTWPFTTPMLVVASPDALHQITQAHVLPKFPAIRSFLHPLANGPDIVSMDGQQWKTWRNIFNPGFSASHLMTLVPDIVQETTTFCQILNEYAKEQTLFTMKSLTDNLAMDVIGKIVLDADLNAQRTKNPMVIALRRQMSWLTFGNEGFPMQRYNPARPFINAYNTYQMDKYLSPKVDARFQIHQDRNRDLKRSKSVIDLALTAYFLDSGHEISNPGLDPRFKSLLMSQVKLFLFSGHDTTSSTICYIFYVLSVYPSVLQRLRAEHDSVFGSDVSKTASLIACDSHLLNQLPYTVAVIKETMRLFPAASTTRSGEPGFTIKDPDRGREYPTFGYLIWLILHAVQRDPEYWPQPDRFLPERWLVSPGDILHPKKGTLRPFEHGPRSCIGKEMSMIEMKIVLALTSREFQIKTVYDEVDRDSSTGIRTVDGERAYQVQHGQPSGNLPCRVTRIVE